MSVPRDPKQDASETEATAPSDAGGTPGAGGEAGGGGTAADAATGAKPDVARLEAELHELRQMLIRRQADFDNFRKRIDRERREDRDRAVAALAEAQLPVLDNFERALAAHQDSAYQEYRRGFEMIYRQLAELLAKHGIARMENPVGRRFDPHSHHAIERVETADQPADTVIEELQAGYTFHSRVLRPAQVRVAVHPSGRAAEPTPKIH
ncbi:MAG TPA: nucleotide exchange factor GrpE [Candidatus Acidoferrales bacterium]|nr:nucleotide exchange factor GrpE [Candidatus Acidoferrales bacterium]